MSRRSSILRRKGDDACSALPEAAAPGDPGQDACVSRAQETEGPAFPTALSRNPAVPGVTDTAAGTGGDEIVTPGASADSLRPRPASPAPPSGTIAPAARRFLAPAGDIFRNMGMRGRDFSAVADDLRSPVLRIPITPRGRAGLRVIRSLPTPVRGLRPSVPVRTVQVPAAGGPVRVLRYERTDRARPGAALLWLHGGGFTFGRPEQSHELCSRWADELGLLVLSVGYRLAPDHPFPSGLDDAYAVLRWAAAEAEALGIRADRIAVGGESAGGGIAAALAQLARDRQEPPVRFQLLQYPMLDDRTVLRASHDGRGQFVWTPANNRFAWTSYLGAAPAQDDDRPYAAPARTANLEGLPSAWIGVGDLDLFHDEDTSYARRLTEAGVACDLHVQAGMYHGADSVVPHAATSLAFRDRMTQALAQGLDVTP